MHAAASLKPALRRGEPEPARQRFRGVHAAASLKRTDLARICLDLSGFPRCARRGLIEAPDPTGCPGRRRGGFRGVHAAASLKRDERQAHQLRHRHRFRGVHAAASLKRQRRCRGCHRSGVFPRCARRGLIEAQIAAIRRAFGSAGFRGVHAAASLKRRQEGHAGGGVVCFRGVHAAASLKPACKVVDRERID